ncbi:MAG: hypothetical protein AMXMBFR13_30710 [Phycisphaerae bacterium]
MLITCLVHVGVPLAILQALGCAFLGWLHDNLISAGNATAGGLQVGAAAGLVGGIVWVVVFTRWLPPSGHLDARGRSRFQDRGAVLAAVELATAVAFSYYYPILQHQSVWSVLSDLPADLIACIIVGLVIGAPLGTMASKQLLGIMDAWRSLDDEQPRCEACGYSLGGHTSRRCPECGRPAVAKELPADQTE